MGVALLLLLAKPPAVAPQTAPPPQQPSADARGRIRATVELVVVPVTVKDARGQLVAGIRPDEFRIFDDGVEQHITEFSAEASPLSVMLLVDDDLKTKPARRVQQSLVAMAGGFGPADEVALARFDAFFTPVLDFTTDNGRLIDALNRMQLGSSFPGVGSGPMTSGPMINNHPAPGAPGVAQAPTQGLPTKHINDAIHAAAEALVGRKRGRRKIIVMVSDGVNAKNNTYSYRDTLRLLLASGVSVYAIGVDAAVLNRGTNLLSRYAHATGGDVYYAARASALAGLYSRATEQARYQYTLGFVPPRSHPNTNYHSIEVRVRRPGLTVLARDGYYLIPPP